MYFLVRDGPSLIVHKLVSVRERCCSCMSLVVFVSLLTFFNSLSSCLRLFPKLPMSRGSLVPEFSPCQKALHNQSFWSWRNYHLRERCFPVMDSPVVTKCRERVSRDRSSPPICQALCGESGMTTNGSAGQESHRWFATWSSPNRLLPTVWRERNKHILKQILSIHSTLSSFH